jgi:predicted transposase/invertase (TIGR01784 family)
VGNPYTELKKVIFLAITTYTLFKDKECYKSDHKILDDKTYENNLEDFSFTFVELPKFTKTLTELEAIEEKWYYFLKHAVETNDIDTILASNPEIKEAYHVLERTRWTERDLMEYERVAMAVADARGVIIAAKKEVQSEIAIKLLQKQYTLDEVAELTSLTVKEVANLQNRATEIPINN